MKATTLKIATALTLTVLTSFANANSSEEFIYNDEDLFNNSIAKQVDQHRPMDAEAVAKLAKAPTRTMLKENLGLSKNIRYTEQDETWFYGLELPTTTKEKCLVAFVFDVKNNNASTVAEVVSFDKSTCENVVAQKLHTHNP
ncbi:hypothetical protein MUB04_14730 [Acinetobacter indicus]|uniref:hypothetical protein n=1 Tax=Acinetobacter TaxID=469 RepID=UPI0015D16822|nr:MULTISPECIES: hypothetical protein [Acinetobacter]MCP0917788.1 hypothetical protein [Acinetobacter indicus]